MKSFKVGDRVRLKAAALNDPTIRTYGLEDRQAIIIEVVSPEVVDLDWEEEEELRSRWNIAWLESADPHVIELAKAEQKWEKYFATPRG